MPEGSIQTVFIGDRALRNTQKQDYLYNLDERNEKNAPKRRYEDLISLCKGKGIKVKQVRVNYENWELEDTWHI